jgi:hypothetical protein
MVADAKAKTVTSLLTQLTVLCAARLCQLFIVIIT